nr:ribulokinase [Gracilibacillus phocaeensis]
MVAGVDFGSDSVRVIMANPYSGDTISSASQYYKRWAKGEYCSPIHSQFRQHPLDYIESFISAFREALTEVGENAGVLLKGIGIDTTGSTPCPVDEYGTPLALLDSFSENPNAMFHLWKDHTAIEEAKELNDILSKQTIDYTKFQGTYSSEWFWAKILRTIRVDKEIKSAAYTWVEHADWFPNLLTGNTYPNSMYRSSCAAGHKALWHSEFNGLPAKECLSTLDSYLGLIVDRYEQRPKNADTAIGTISEEWSNILGINKQTIISGSSFDAHAGAVGAGITPNTLVKVAGTSTVDMLIAKPEEVRGKDLRHICGQAEDSIIPGYTGIEAGQAAFGDIYAWYKELLIWPIRNYLESSTILTKQQKNRMLKEYSDNLLFDLEKAIRTDIGKQEQIVSLDWFNGRRYPVLNENVKGSISGLSLGTTAPDIYQSLILATIFGSKKIFNSWINNGFKIDKLILIGGISQKSPYIMQLMADILNRPIMVCQEEQVCAKGASIYASVASGIYEDIPTAQQAFCPPYQADYIPDTKNRNDYEAAYHKYLELGESIESIS